MKTGVLFFDGPHTTTFSASLVDLGTKVSAGHTLNNTGIAKGGNVTKVYLWETDTLF